MGLIKTGLTLAGSYGLIKAASKAANSHEEKKQQRGSHQQYPNNVDPGMNYGPNPNGPPNGYYQNPYQAHQMPPNGYYQHPPPHHPQNHHQHHQIYEMPANHQNFGHQAQHNRVYEMPANGYVHSNQAHGYQPSMSNTTRSVSPPSSQSTFTHDTRRQDSPVSSQH